MAIVAGLAPRRFWTTLEIHLPLRSAAVVSGLVTLLTGIFLGVGGFLAFGTQLASANDWAATTMWRKNRRERRRERRQIARTRLEGADAPDVLRPGPPRSTQNSQS